MANTFHVDHFRSPKNLAFIVYALVGLQVIAFAVGIIASLSYLIEPDWSFTLDDGTSSPVFLMFIGLSTILRIGAFILTIVFFLIWVHRAYSNLSPLKARNIEFSPGWAVGWWFIPFANLVKAYQVMRELWTASDPDLDERLDFMPAGSSSNSVLGFWWGTYLVGNVILRISDKQFDAATSQYKTAILLYLIGSSVLIVSAALLIILVSDITNRQLQRKAKLETIGYGNELPPPPPTFASEMA
jgi:hypothetical protein